MSALRPLPPGTDRSVMYEVTIRDDAGIEIDVAADTRDFVAWERRTGRSFREAVETFDGQYAVAFAHCQRKGKIPAAMTLEKFVEAYVLLADTTKTDTSEPDPTNPGASTATP